MLIHYIFLITQKSNFMPKYIIEREIPGAGQLTDKQLEAIFQISNDVLDKLGPLVKWEHSYLTNDKLYCVYTAPNKDVIRDHARKVGIPANNISEILEVMDINSHPSDHVHESWYYE